ncbi:MAG: ATP-binding protein [Oscillospiraceae bacterium]|nr:ATP-binding protein [Oscillospiraceae bacterium]
MENQHKGKTLEEIIAFAEYMPGYTTVYQIDHGIKRVYYSANVPALTGHTSEEYATLGRDDPTALILPTDREAMMDKLLQGIAQRSDIDLSYRLVSKTHQLVWVRAHAKYVGEHDGCPLLLTSIYDVTDEWESRNLLLEVSDRGVVVLDKGTKEILYGNSKFFQLSGVSEADAIGRPCYEVICGQAGWEESRCACFRALKAPGFVEYHDAAGGRYFQITARDTRWGEHEAAVFYLHDITENKKKDLELSARNAQLREVQREAIKSYQRQLDAVMRMNPDAMSTFQMNLSKNLCQNGVSAYPALLVLQEKGTADGYFEEAKKHIAQTEHQKMLAKFSRGHLLQAFAAGELTVSCDCHYELAPDDTRYIRTTISMAENPLSHDVEGIIYAVDLTRRELDNNIMRQLFEHQYEGIATIDKKTGRCSLRQFAYDEAFAENFRELDYAVGLQRMGGRFVLEQEREEYEKNASLENVVSQLEKRDVYAFSTHFKKPDGSSGLKKISYYYLTAAHDTILAVTEDITELTRREQARVDELRAALLRADRAIEAKAAFFSNISHDMRTPLNGILGFAHLAGEAKTVQEKDDCLDKIRSSGEFLLQLINDTLDMSKIESGSMTLNPESVPASEVVNGVVSSVERAAAEKGIQLVVSIPEEIQKSNIVIDKMRLQQVFVNLLGNAIKFTPPGGRVEFYSVAVEPPVKGANYRVTVKDNGIGMSREFIPHAFEAYSQQSGAASQQTMGTGLGLAIVKQIVALMGGFIELQSEEGQGTQFDVYLPVKTAEAAQKAPETKGTVADLSGKRILLCEDHPINRELAVRLLRSRGMEVTSAENGKIGLEAFRQSREGWFDAILMDVRMPVMDGLEAARTIRLLDRRDAAVVPIIAMTANAFASDREESLAAGMNAHLSKPIIPAELFGTLSKHIGKED